MTEKRKTINGEDILTSMRALGFDNYEEVLKIYLAKYREVSLGLELPKRAEAHWLISDSISSHRPSKSSHTTRMKTEGNALERRRKKQMGGNARGRTARRRRHEGGSRRVYASAHRRRKERMGRKG